MLGLSSCSDYEGKESLVALQEGRQYYQWLLEEFRGYLGKVVAEVGAGVGTFSRALLQEKIETLWALEPARNLLPSLQENLAAFPQAKILPLTLEQALPNLAEQCHTVLYVNVLEHIADHEKELLLARQALRPQGFLCLFVPALPMLYSRFDRKIGHVRRYRKRELFQLAESVGLVPTKAKYVDWIGAVLWYGGMVLAGAEPTVTMVRLYDRWIVPLTKNLEKMFSPPFGKNLLFVAQKP
ncbi:class I SAM-dependent methyltransferase [Candidatus Methylacidithermus pantelleriae]|uniref:Methyltransferase type 12 domain-containing protein n=1 Tax=Candidatus Methylacidithermus pantelleriae TaxID=2744239 RepID=A0A8J2FTZ7_9BACT|nr:class I SAM-dependent methyltransferase [Candidatus Methylacidithermus pantelleriae]CAF0705317.1 conserved hypothetical protein [Candidatus Methylacidithermus pantelleriae]